MSFVNMGTPGHPEGVPHWSVKSMMAHKLRLALNFTPREYASLLPNELRNVQVPEQLQDPLLMQALDRIKDRVVPRPGYSYVAYREMPHDGCQGGTTLVNVLAGLLGGEVRLEEPYAGYVPDIALYAKDATTPSCIIEVVDTSSPSEAKIATMQRKGIPVYSLRADNDPWDVLHQPVVEVEMLANPACGAPLRKERVALLLEWAEADSPFVGIRTYPSGAQEYLLGEGEYFDVEWQWGDPEVRGWIRDERASWPSLPNVKPVKGRTRAIRRDLFMSFLIWQRCGFVQLEAESRDTADKGYVRGLTSLFIKYIDELLSMVRYPVGPEGQAKRQ